MSAKALTPLNRPQILVANEVNNMAKLDIDKKLAAKKGKPMSKFMGKALRTFLATPNSKKMNLEIVDEVGMKNVKGPFVVLSNHTSRCDWQYIALAVKPHMLNYVASYIEFHRAHMHAIFDLTSVIPKKNFVADSHCIKEIMSVIKLGGNVILFPEGKSSISGTNQPVALGTGKLLKHLNVPVYTTTITGGYMSNTQWNIADRPGKVIIKVKQLFTPEQTQTIAPEEMDRMVDAAIYNDDFVWNETARVKYKGTEHIAEKLEEHLYICPKCGKEFTQHGENNVFTCGACGNSVKINEYYDLIPNSDGAVVPKNLRVWFELQRRRVFREIRDNADFCLEEPVTIGYLPSDHYVPKTATSEPCGEGMLRITRNEFSFKGTKLGQPFEIHAKTQNMTSVVFETDSHCFGAFFDGDYYEFEPKRPSGSKWLLSVEECHRRAGGKWQNTLPQQQWIYADNKPTDNDEYYLAGCAPKGEPVF